jgi:hypothetical protein
MDFEIQTAHYLIETAEDTNLKPESSLFVKNLLRS